jgi:hypothetical protein
MWHLACYSNKSHTAFQQAQTALPHRFYQLVGVKHSACMQ